MSLKTWLSFILEHNAVLIEILVGLIILVAAYLIYRNAMTPEDSTVNGASVPNMKELEETLKKILEKANQVPAGQEPAAGAAASPAAMTGDNSALVNEINLLKKNLEERQLQIETLKKQPAAAGGASSGLTDQEKTKLETQINELKGKLQEYEIISEDIADLSHYKEENVKLQKQLESLKAGGAAPAAPPVEPASPPPAAAPATPVEAAPVAEAAPAAPAEAPAAPIETGIDEDLMKEFSAAVDEQKGVPPGTTAAASEAADVGALGAMDMDKMLSEATELGAKAADAPDASVEKALGETIDADKLLLEANSMTAVKPEDSDLMGQFENFVKKE